jgi:hypothetical protein
MTEQALSALEFANEVRLARAKVLREIRAGRRRADRVITDPPELCGGMTILSVLKAQRQWGTIRARRFLYLTRTNPITTLGELSIRQRRDITARLNGNG